MSLPRLVKLSSLEEDLKKHEQRRNPLLSLKLDLILLLKKELLNKILKDHFPDSPQTTHESQS